MIFCVFVLCQMSDIQYNLIKIDTFLLILPAVLHCVFGPVLFYSLFFSFFAIYPPWNPSILYFVYIPPSYPWFVPFVSVFLPSSQLNVTALDWTQLSKKECVKYGGSLVGKSCKYVPDLALMSFILFFGTYTMTVTLKKFKFSRYFPTKVSFFFSDFYTCTFLSFTSSFMSKPWVWLYLKKSCQSLTFILHFPNYWWDLVRSVGSYIMLEQSKELYTCKIMKGEQVDVSLILHVANKTYINVYLKHIFMLCTSWHVWWHILRKIGHFFFLRV